MIIYSIYLGSECRMDVCRQFQIQQTYSCYNEWRTLRDNRKFLCIDLI